jgi:hypothetical protein
MCIMVLLPLTDDSVTFSSLGSLDMIKSARSIISSIINDPIA